MVAKIIVIANVDFRCYLGHVIVGEWRLTLSVGFLPKNRPCPLIHTANAITCTTR